MKFINYLSSIAGIGIFPLISLLVFFIFFTLLGFYVYRADKSRMNYLAALPVEDDAPQDKTRR
jgi:cbb3-type cytochrome oxidase subunit 3